MLKIIYSLSILIFLLGCTNNNEPPQIDKGSKPTVEQTCSDGFDLDKNSGKCIEQKKFVCNAPLIKKTSSNECICPGKARRGNPLYGESYDHCFCNTSIGEIYDDKINDCRCFDGASYNEIEKKCIADCKSTEEYSPTYRYCIPRCDKSKNEIYDDRILKCREVCPEHYVFSYYAEHDTCVADCKGNSILNPKDIKTCLKGKSLKYLIDFKDHSVLRLFLMSAYSKIIIVTPEETSQSKVEEYKKMVETALNIWFDPLRKFATLEFKYRFKFYETHDYFIRPLYPNEIAFYISKNLEHKQPYTQGWSVYVNLDDKLHTYIHEIGHLLNFDDLYTYTKGPCIEGYSEHTTVMCVSADHLKPADIDGIRDLYCLNFPEQAECKTDYHLPIDPVITIQ